MKGIILHGGHGTRLRPLTHTGPKQLLPIANKPMSNYCLESIIETGINEIAIIIGGIGSNKVREYYGDGSNFGVKITYIEQDEPKGIAHAIRLCKDFVNNDNFLVFLGDNIIQKSIHEIVKKFNVSNEDVFDATILLCKVDNPSRFGIAEVKNDKIIKITEKPKEPRSNLAVTGIYLLTPKIFDVIDNLKPSWRNELEITDALDSLLQQNNNISYQIITDYWKDTGTPEDIIHANGEILKKMKSNHPYNLLDQIKGEESVIVGSNCNIDSDTLLVGPIMIGDGCQISDCSKIGPNVSIGNDSEIRRCEIKNSIVMENCKIDSNSKISNSIISKNSEVMENKNSNNGRFFLLGEGSKISI